MQKILTFSLRCKDCVFWAPFEEPDVTARDTLELTGECHRYPPQFENNIGYRFPHVAAENGCGEWQQNKE